MLEAFEGAREARSFERGDLLFLEGSPSAGVFCLQSCRVKLSRSCPDGKLQLVALAGPGQFLGHRELLTGQVNTCSAEVISPGKICLIDRETVHQALQRDPALSRNVMLALSSALDLAESRLLEMARMRASARIASLLLQCSEGAGAVDPLTREEMAQICGLTLESVSRAVRAMGRQGVLGFQGRRIFVRDRPALERLRTG